MAFFCSIIVSFGVFSAVVSLILILFFLGDFAHGRLLQDRSTIVNGPTFHIK